MALNTKDFNTIVSDTVAAMQAAATAVLDFTVGSVLYATVQAMAAVVLWLQGMIVYVLTLTRAATSSSTDLDSWMADFSFTRLPAVASTGTVTFSRFTPTAQAVIAVGTAVQTADGTQGFTVTADGTNPAYNAGLGGYVMAAGVSSVSVPVIATTAGAAGNVQAGTVTVIAQSGVPADTVTNTSLFAGGQDAESDAAYRARWALYLAGLFKATKAAIQAAIEGVQAGLYNSLTENQTYAGAAQLGYFYAVVDDGSGTPSSALLGNVAAAIDAVRPFTVTFNVYAPVVVDATVVMTITTDSGYVHATVATAVATALQTFIDGLAVGEMLPYTQLAAVAYGVAGVINVTGVTLNGATADLAVTAQQVIKCPALPTVN